MRCLHSIYNRTPPELLHEIILTNDNSTNSDLFAPLESYVHEHFGGKVKLFVNTERKGLILTRMEGAMRASGDVIVFFDSHMEVNVNWLPPLIEPIALNRRTATVPVLDSFSPFTLEYERLGHGTRGGFDWNMVYKWFPMRPIDLKTSDKPFPLPVMTGGAYAIRRDYFIELGGYDKGLKVWNGENFEMSFKLWLCGGQLLKVPCSHVAHTSKLREKYREVNYGFDFSTRNLKRVAEVWMDEYKDEFYKMDPKRYSLDAGDLTEAFAVKKRLNCKPFKDFFDIAPEILLRYPPASWGNFASGAIVSQADPNLCISFKYKKFEDPLELTICSENKTIPYMNQHFILTWNRFIKYNDPNWKCIDAVKMNLMDCHFTFGNQLWKIDPKTNQILSPGQGKCISGDPTTLKLSWVACNSSDINQSFKWGYLNVTAVENWETFGIPLPK
jgi:polypeptide N-acetylgalactosaminyltransferase